MVAGGALRVRVVEQGLGWGRLVMQQRQGQGQAQERRQGQG